MIGGNDVVIPAVGDAAALEACVRIVQRRWPHARYEDALTGQKYESYEDIPFGSIRELFAYPDPASEAMWDADSPDSPANSMLHLIASPDHITAVLDDPSTGEMRSIIESIRLMMRMDLLNSQAEAV